AAIRDADANLGRLLGALESAGSLERTALAVVSDHGYASIDPVVDPLAPLLAAGLTDDLEAGRLILANNGFTLFVNVPGGERGLIRKVAEAFQDWEQGGSIFSGARGQMPIDGTLP